MNPAFATWESAVAWLRTQPDQRQLVLDAYYDDPLERSATRYYESAEWQAIRALLPQGAGRRALDVGAGRGIASFALAREGYEVTALEPDPSALVGAEAIRNLARAERLAISVVEEFSERLPFADATFDLVFARAVLHHTSDLASACREFHRVLKPGGTLLAVREHVISTPTDLPAFLARHPLHRLYGGENAFQLVDYSSAIERAGLTLHQVLAPLRSPINLAPQTIDSARCELARRLAPGSPWLERLITGALGFPGAWSMLLPLLERVDHRPGRLYSFLARRP